MTMMRDTQVSIATKFFQYCSGHNYRQKYGHKMVVKTSAMVNVKTFIELNFQ